VLRHVRGLGVHHAQFALRDLVSPLTESFVMPVRKCWRMLDCEGGRPSRTEGQGSPPSRRLRSK
jgi:hypothetical protein